MLHRVDDGVDASRRCRVTRDRDVRTTNKLRMTKKAEAPNFSPVEIKEDEENPWPHLSKQFAFQRKRGNSYNAV